MSLPTPSEVVSMYRERSDHMGHRASIMREVSRFYDGEVTVPMPELDQTEQIGRASCRERV